MKITFFGTVKAVIIAAYKASVGCTKVSLANWANIIKSHKSLLAFKTLSLTGERMLVNGRGLFI